MEYKDLEKVNDELTTIDIKGKDYVEVNKRVLAFRKLFPNGAIVNNLESLENGVVVMSSTIYDEDGHILAKDYAYEKENSSFINKTSFIENCSTSATGRALGDLGIGINTSIASYEEVQNAILNQNADKKITKTQVEALKMAIENNKLQEVFVIDVLTKYKYYKLEDIKVKDYADIVNDLKKGCEE